MKQNKTNKKQKEKEKQKKKEKNLHTHHYTNMCDVHNVHYRHRYFII